MKKTCSDLNSFLSSLCFQEVKLKLVLFLDQNDANKQEKTEDVIAVPRCTKVSSISLNIPAAGLGSRPPSIVSTSTLDEGGFNEPFPEIKAKLKPHEDSLSDYPIKDDKSESVSEISEEKKIEALYAVPHKPSSFVQQKSTTSTDSSASQVTVIPQQKSIDSDIMYNNPPDVITNSVLAELESQESYEKHCKEALQREEDRLSCDDSTTDLTDSAIDLRNSHEKSEPFLMTRESLHIGGKTTLPTDVQKSEANILDLNDVEYADASDNEQDNKIRNSVPEADAMTPAEAENLLSTK